VVPLEVVLVEMLGLVCYPDTDLVAVSALFEAELRASPLELVGRPGMDGPKRMIALVMLNVFKG
jgi:hypothetical protein